MTVKYKFMFDHAYCKAVISRYYRQRPLLLRLPVQFGFVSTIFALAWFAMGLAVLSPFNLVRAACLAGAFIISCAFVVRAGVLRKLKRNLNFGREVSIGIADAGIDASDAHGHSSIKWTAYPRSVRYPDGILLLRGGAIRWLPDASIVEGSVESAIALVTSKTQFRQCG